MKYCFAVVDLFFRGGKEMLKMVNLIIFIKIFPVKDCWVVVFFITTVRGASADAKGRLVRLRSVIFTFSRVSLTKGVPAWRLLTLPAW